MPIQQTNRSWFNHLVVAALGLGNSFATSDLRRLARHGRNADSPALPDNLDYYFEGRKDICITSAYDPEVTPEAPFALSHQEAYARRHGYKYFAFKGEVPHVEVPSGKYSSWPKEPALNTLAMQVDIRGKPVCRWLMWADPDVVFTNPAEPIERILWKLAADSVDGSSYGRTEVLLSRDQTYRTGNFITTGVFFVANTAFGGKFVSDTGQAFEDVEDLPTAERDAIQTQIFHTDASMLTYEHRAALESRVAAKITLVPNRAFNSLYWVGTDPGRAPGALWQPCDFVARFTEVPSEERDARIREAVEAAQGCETLASEEHATRDTQGAISVAVAHYDEDLSWLSDVANTSVVYCKGAATMGVRPALWKHLPNIGGVPHTYLHHIVHNYHSLAPMTLFTQGDIVAGVGKFWGIEPMMARLTTEANTLITYRPVEFFNSWEGLKDLPQRDALGLGHMRHAKRTPKEYWQWVFHGAAPPTEIPWVPMATLGVPRDTLHSRPLGFYRRLLQHLDNLHHANPEEAIYLEIFWMAIFNARAGDYPRT